jgi:hypothetical protein
VLQRSAGETVVALVEGLCVLVEEVLDTLVVVVVVVEEGDDE